MPRTTEHALGFPQLQGTPLAWAAVYSSALVWATSTNWGRPSSEVLRQPDTWMLPWVVLVMGINSLLRGLPSSNWLQGLPLSRSNKV
jgi:hypothetical protein